MENSSITRYEAADWLFDIIIERGYKPTNIPGFLRDKKGIKDDRFAREVSDVLLRSTLVEKWGNDPHWYALCANINGMEAKEKYNSLSEYIQRNRMHEYSETERLEFIQNIDNSVTIQNHGSFEARDIASHIQKEIQPTKKDKSIKSIVLDVIVKHWYKIIIPVIVGIVTLFIKFRFFPDIAQ